MAVNRKSFKRFTLAEYIDYLRPFVSKVKFSEIHVHATWKPTIAQFRKDGGQKLVESMWRFHTGTQGWSDIAQHATIDPDGYIWEGRSLLTPPASATSHNDPDSDAVHPFMFEMIGNFDKGCERLEGAQLATAAGLCKAIMQLWGRGADMIHFHNEFTNAKTCPGSGIDKAWFIAQVAAAGVEKVSPPPQEAPKMDVKEATAAIQTLQHLWGLVDDKDKQKEIHNVANYLRAAAGIPLT